MESDLVKWRDSTNRPPFGAGFSVKLMMMRLNCVYRSQPDPMNIDTLIDEPLEI